MFKKALLSAENDEWSKLQYALVGPCCIVFKHANEHDHVASEFTKVLEKYQKGFVVKMS